MARLSTFWRRLCSGGKKSRETHNISTAANIIRPLTGRLSWNFPNRRWQHEETVFILFNFCTPFPHRYPRRRCQCGPRCCVEKKRRVNSIKWAFIDAKMAGNFSYFSACSTTMLFSTFFSGQLGAFALPCAMTVTEYEALKFRWVAKYDNWGLSGTTEQGEEEWRRRMDEWKVENSVKQGNKLMDFQFKFTLKKRNSSPQHHRLALAVRSRSRNNFHYLEEIN